MRYESDQETSTTLPAATRYGEIADRGTRTTMRGYASARYTPHFGNPSGYYVYDLADEEDAE